VFGPDGLLQLVNAAFHEIWSTDAEMVWPSMHASELLPLVRGLTVETEVWQQLMAYITGADSRQSWTARLTLGTGRILRARFASLPDGSTMAVFGTSPTASGWQSPCANATKRWNRSRRCAVR
jgi:hypothetical protein